MVTLGSPTMNDSQSFLPFWCILLWKGNVKISLLSNATETWARPLISVLIFFFSVLKLLQKIWKTLQKHFQVLSHIETFGKMFLRHFWAVPCTEGTFSVSKNYVLLLWDPPSNIKKKSTKGNTWKNNIQIEIQICHQMKNLQYFWKILIYSFNFYFQFPCFEISFLIACPLWKLYPFLY